MDTAQWPQEIVVKPIDEIVTNTCIKQPSAPPMTAAGGVSAGSVGGVAVERKAVRPLKDQALNCPRCNSTNTKFCYYNNYSLTQPRYFCKTCRRYWTEGGSLRNIPVGGGSRKNKRSSSSSSPSLSSSSKKPLLAGTASQQQAGITGLSGHPNPKSKNAHEAEDLNLAFPHGYRSTQNGFSEYLQVPNIKNPLVSSNCSSSSSALELITGITSSSCSTAFMTLPSAIQDPSSIYTAATGFGLNYPMQEFMRPALGFSLDGGGGGGGGGGYGGDPHDPLNQEDGPNTTATAGGRLLFPFENLKLPVSSSSTNSGSGGGGDNGMDHHLNHHNQHHDDGSDDHNEKEQRDQSAGFWTGMLGGGLGGGSSWQL